MCRQWEGSPAGLRASTSERYCRPPSTAHLAASIARTPRAATPRWHRDQLNLATTAAPLRLEPRRTGEEQVGDCTRAQVPRTAGARLPRIGPEGPRSGLADPRRHGANSGRPTPSPTTKRRCRHLQRRRRLSQRCRHRWAAMELLPPPSGLPVPLQTCGWWRCPPPAAPRGLCPTAPAAGGGGGGGRGLGRRRE
jgi:hypothetical protein